MDAPLCKLCEKRHWGSCADPRFPGTGSKKARPKKKSRQRAPGLPDGEARLYPPTVLDSDGKALPASEQIENAPRVMRPAAQLPVEDRLTALEQIVDELLAGRRKRSEYMKIYMRDRRANG